MEVHLQPCSARPCKHAPKELRMQFLLAGLVFGLPFLQPPAPGPRLTRSAPLLVQAVIDGDTIDVAAFGRVRLLGIDAPELGRGFDTSAPFGREARDRLVSLV